MAKINITRKVVRSISEWSVFKITIIAYLIFFALGVIVFAIFSLLTWMGLEISGLSFASAVENMGLASTMQSFGVDITDMNLFAGGMGVIGIIIFVVVGLLFSVVYAAIATFFTWIFNVILKISGGIELRFIDRNASTAEKKVSKPVQSD
ncbi:MAG: DUF3566 domain-containing protein [Actinomycetota bacterium]|jgi:hypothetical protein|nr:DUF3566 domain-containing protein [Actinomycetota bacterium]